MEVRDLQPNQGKIDLVLTITEKSEPRTFEKFGKTGSVCKAKAKDDTGEVTITLWNEDIDKVKTGDKIHVKNGWCSEYQGELQVSSGKFGEIEVLANGSPPETVGNEVSEAPETESPSPEPQPEPTPEPEPTPTPEPQPEPQPEPMSEEPIKEEETIE